MIKPENKSKKAQVALEYIAAALVFATVGIASFLAINQAVTLSTMGEASTYHSTDTIVGLGLDDGVDPEQYQYPSDWAEPQPELGGAIPENTIQQGQEDVSDWDDSQEQGWVDESSQREYWLDDDPERRMVDFQDDMDQESYTSQELQQEYSDYTNQWLTQNPEGYTAERIQEIDQVLDQPWFTESLESGE